MSAHITAAILRDFIALAVEHSIETGKPLIESLDDCADIYPDLTIAESYSLTLENTAMQNTTTTNPFAAHFAARDAQIKADIDQTLSEIRCCRDAGDKRSVRDLSRKLRELRRACKLS